MKPVAVVLAAGASTRFGAENKLLAPLDGEPVLQHTLNALVRAGMHDVVVVLGADADADETAIRWRGERRVVNERPEDGSASSIRLGLDAAVEVPDADAVLIVLGDQPTLRPGVVRAVLAVAESPGAATAHFVRPRYADDPAPNPVLVRRAAWALAAGLEGDWGLGALLANQSDRVVEVPVEGANPDVDTPADLAAVSATPAEDLR